jgi:hypothetical protein
MKIRAYILVIVILMVLCFSYSAFADDAKTDQVSGDNIQEFDEGFSIALPEGFVLAKADYSDDLLAAQNAYEYNGEFEQIKVFVAKDKVLNERVFDRLNYVKRKDLDYKVLTNRQLIEQSERLDQMVGDLLPVYVNYLPSKSELIDGRLALVSSAYYVDEEKNVTGMIRAYQFYYMGNTFTLYYDTLIEGNHYDQTAFHLFDEIASSVDFEQSPIQNIKNPASMEQIAGIVASPIMALTTGGLLGYLLAVLAAMISKVRKKRLDKMLGKESEIEAVKTKPNEKEAANWNELFTEIKAEEQADKADEADKLTSIIDDIAKMENSEESQVDDETRKEYDDLFVALDTEQRQNFSEETPKAYGSDGVYVHKQVEEVSQPLDVAIAPLVEDAKIINAVEKQDIDFEKSLNSDDETDNEQEVENVLGDVDGTVIIDDDKMQNEQNADISAKKDDRVLEEAKVHDDAAFDTSYPNQRVFKSLADEIESQEQIIESNNQSKDSGHMAEEKLQKVENDAENKREQPSKQVMDHLDRKGEDINFDKLVEENIDPMQEYEQYLNRILPKRKNQSDEDATFEDKGIDKAVIDQQFKSLQNEISLFIHKDKEAKKKAKKTKEPQKPKQQTGVVSRFLSKIASMVERDDDYEADELSEVTSRQELHKREKVENNMLDELIPGILDEVEEKEEIDIMLDEDEEIKYLNKDKDDK